MGAADKEGRQIFRGATILLPPAEATTVTDEAVFSALLRAAEELRGFPVDDEEKEVLGGFNGSLQHLLKEVSNGTTTGLGFGTDRKTNNAIARQARCQSARDKASVLDLCCARHGERGCGARVWRVPTFGAKMVS